MAHAVAHSYLFPDETSCGSEGDGGSEVCLFVGSTDRMLSVKSLAECNAIAMRSDAFRPLDRLGVCDRGVCRWREV